MAEADTTIIQGKSVGIVEENKNLGIIFGNLLKVSSNTEEVLRKRQLWVYLLSNLRLFGVSKNILTMFYYCFIESVNKGVE